MVRRQINPNNRAPPRQDEALNDPLANVEQFNIIQFLQEGDFNLPLEQFEQEPLHEPKPEPVLHHPMEQQHQQQQMMMQNPQMHQQLQHQQMYQQQPQQQHHQQQQHQQQHQQQQHQLQQQQQQQQQMQMGSGMPMMPAVTDLTRHGSSSSPSTVNSDPPYSPDGVNQYGLGTHRMNRGVISNDQQRQQQQQQQHMPQQFDQRMQNHQMTSPQTASQYPMVHSQQPTPATYQSVSPESQTFAPSSLYNVLNVSSDDSISGGSDENHLSRKRPRVELPTAHIDASYILNAALTGKAFADIVNEENGGQPNIKFFKYKEENWCTLFDIDGQEVTSLQVHVVADKGFNYSTNDNCFVNQKKNHFQISVHIESSDENPPHLFRNRDGACVPIEHFLLSFKGVRAESLTSVVQIRQSTTDRRPVLHTPVPFKILERRMTKVTVPRLHFSETTLNNQRKNLRPNPDQKYFMLVTRLDAIGTDGTANLVQSFASERVIVRATNPGSFEPPETVEASWSKNGPVLSTAGPVVIGNSEPRAKLTVDGDIYLSGRVNCPSDIRLKEHITEKEASDALENLQKLRIVDYFYKPEVAEKWGLSEEQRKRTGVIAQELATVLPDAVKDIGDYLTVNESRVFYETVLATQELCRLTGDLEQKIDEKVDEISKRLSDYAHKKKVFGSIASSLNTDTKSISASHASLDSALSVVTVNNTKKNRRGNRRNRNRQAREEPAVRPPRSKLSHMTMIGLVGVMAFCLIAMSALYILDWHNRNYGFHHGSPSTTTSGPRGEGPGNLVIPLDTFVPLSQPDAPPLAGKCPVARCHEYCCRDWDEAHPEDPKYDASSRNSDYGDEEYNPEGRSDFTVKDFGHDIRIELPELGMWIDERYCIEKSCSLKRKVFNLFIPMTRWMPNDPIEIKFHAPISRYIDNCGYIPEFENMQCSERAHIDLGENPVPKSELLFENHYRVSGAEWAQSGYRFRVGYSSGLCDHPDGSFGGFYEEFNLVFYRTCLKSATNGTRNAK